MAGRTKRAGLVLTQDQEAMLRRLAGSRTAPVREVERAKVLLGYAQGIPITDLARQIGVSRPTVSRMLRSLEELGLVERRRSDVDRRQLEVSLTYLGV